MLRHVGGQIVGCNVVAGVENGLIEPHLARDAFAWLGRLAANRGYRDPTSLVEALRVLRSGDFHPSMSDPRRPPDFRLRGEQDLNARGLRGGLSSIIPAFLLNDLILSDDLDTLRGEGLFFPFSATGPLSSTTVEEWRRRPAAERRVRLDPNQTMGRHRSVVWFTRRQDIEASLASKASHERAQRARDCLGLVHHEHDVVLAAMHFPDEVFRRSTSARPTFLDAADHRRFRAWPDGGRSRSNRQWGCTVDLEALAERFEFELLGPVTDSTGTDPADDVAFSGRLQSQLGGLSVDDLRIRLTSYL